MCEGEWLSSLTATLLFLREVLGVAGRKAAAEGRQLPQCEA